MNIKVINTQRNSKNCIICGMENQLGLKAPFYNLEDDSVASVFKFKNVRQVVRRPCHRACGQGNFDERF